MGWAYVCGFRDDSIGFFVVLEIPQKCICVFLHIELILICISVHSFGGRVFNYVWVGLSFYLSLHTCLSVLDDGVLEGKTESA